MNVKILSHTENPEKIIAAAAKLCYSSAVDIDSLMDNLTAEKTEEFIKKLTSLGHESPMEHASYTFAVEGVSRSLLAQITRHRMASFSVRSQRYCAEDNSEVVEPLMIRRNGSANTAFKESVDKSFKVYSDMLNEGIKKEDARSVLPNACTTRFIVTMNVRELMHFFNLRCCTRAQAEIRELATKMLDLCREESPILFKNAGPSCVKGYCPEGNMSCGKAPTLEELCSAYKKNTH